MTAAVDVDQVRDVHVRVNFGGAEPGVPEHLLDVEDVGAAFEHERRHRVPEQMATAALPDPAFFDVGVNEIADDAGRDALAVSAVKNRARVRPGLELGAGVFQISSGWLVASATPRFDLQQGETNQLRISIVSRRCGASATCVSRPSRLAVL